MIITPSQQIAANLTLQVEALDDPGNWQDFADLLDEAGLQDEAQWVRQNPIEYINGLDEGFGFEADGREFLITLELDTPFYETRWFAAAAGFAAGAVLGVLLARRR